MKPLLSLCMIVRDEEKVLRRCLESVQNLVDEIIIVDTGSTDCTKEIALDFTNKIYEFEWINDFSAAKNKAISYATSKWILILDADEYINPDDHAYIIDILNTEDYTKPLGYTVPILNLTGSNGTGNLIESFAVRIISNHPDINFYRPIHEQIQYKYGEILLQRMDFSIYHTGYTAETVDSKNKRTRNLTIFEAMKATKQFEEYDYFTLANEYDAMGDSKKALYYYKRADTKKTQNKTFNIYCKHKIITILARLGNIKEAMEINEECIQRWTQYADFMYIKADFMKQIGLSNQAIELFEKCIHLAEEKSSHHQNFWAITPDIAILSYSSLATLYQETHNYSKAVTALTKLIELKKDELKNLIKLVELLLITDKESSVIAFLNNLYPKNSETSTHRLLQMCLFIGNSEMSQYYYNQYISLSLNMEINTTYLLHYAIITGDIELFKANLHKDILPEDLDYYNRLVGLALCIWQDPSFTSYLKVTSDNSLIINSLSNLIIDQTSNVSQEVDIQFIYQLLIELFKSKYFDAYDWLIQRFPEYQNIFTNFLGDYFYAHQQLELAFDYYSMSLQNNTLNALGYENIGLYYLNHDNATDAAEYLKKAIDLNPTRLSLYVRLLSNCPEKDHVQKYKLQFNRIYPQYTNLSIIKPLLKK